MAKLRLAQFSGEVPRLISRLLPEGGSQLAENVRLDDGGLTPIRKSRLEHEFTPGSDYETIYKFGATWLGWATVVHAVPGPVATDRLYYTGDGVPKMRVGATVYDLAVPFPSAALTVTPTGVGSGDITTRLYVYTWVTDYDEESEPCPVSASVNYQTGLTITLSGFAAAPAGRAISKQRIYRSQSSNQAGTDLFLIDERSATVADYVDLKGPAEFAEVLPSKDYNAPPSDLAGLISMSNGILVGFSGKKLCFSEPFKPHAWPEKYQLTSPFTIVGIGSYGTTVVAGTSGYPYVVSGNAPESMVEEKIELNLPCVNGRGLVDLGYSVAYPSNDGLVVVSNSGATVATDALYTRPKWQQLNPGTFIAGQFAGRYFASYSYTDAAGQVSEGIRIIDLTGQQPFVSRASVHPSAFHYDQPSGAMYYLVDDTIYEWDAFGETREVMTWTSKQFILPAPVSFGAILVDSGSDLTAEDQIAYEASVAAVEDYNEALFLSELNAEIDGHELNGMALGGDDMLPIPSAKYISVRVYAEGRLVRTVSELDRVKRIPPILSKVWEIQVNGTANVEQVVLASTVRELNEV